MQQTLDMKRLMDFGRQYHWTMDGIVVAGQTPQSHVVALALSNNTVMVRHVVEEQSPQASLGFTMMQDVFSLNV